jgi:hypothetical protein
MCIKGTWGRTVSREKAEYRSSGVYVEGLSFKRRRGLSFAQSRVCFAKKAQHNVCTDVTMLSPTYKRTISHSSCNPDRSHDRSGWWVVVIGVSFLTWEGYGSLVRGLSKRMSSQNAYRVDTSPNACSFHLYFERTRPPPKHPLQSLSSFRRLASSQSTYTAKRVRC